MGPSSSISLSILSVILIFSVLWKPAYSDDKCSVGCVGSPSGPSFLSGHKYEYGVEGTVTVYLTGADKQETSVKLLGQVSVSAVGNCEHVLKVKNLVISGPDGKKYNKPPGIEKPVRFSLQDGRVGAEICAEEGDSERSLNIKRAIISLLQTEQKSSTQVDVFGACPTEASSSQEGSAVLVHRSRDLSRCAHREQGRNDLMTGVYNPTAEIKDTQVLQSVLRVESKVQNGVPEKVSATEEYLYRPFSVGENGARAKVHTKLTLTGKSSGADNGHCTVPRTIIFVNPHDVKTDQSNVQSAVSIVKETAKTLVSEASSKSASHFAQVVRVLRSTNKDDLMKVYNQVKGNNLEKRVFLDGLLRAGTGYSIEASIQLLKHKDLSELEQQLVYLSLGNAKYVNNEAVKAAATLLDLPNLPKETYLGVGALAGAYCREHHCHNTNPEGIVALSNKLAAKLQNCRPKNKVEEDNVVAVLKGIRNIHHLQDNLIDKVVRCASDNNVKARVRAAALEAFHADPCSAKLKKTALDLMKNRQLDSEIRIKAYLAVIECPCGKSANEIKNLLETEPVHQVGRFITSSLRHIRASANPDKQHARHHYGQIRTPNKFNVDDRKYSFYREASYNVDALGLGGNVEETVIYSQDSFLPRSASFNLTAEVFGHSLNVLEVGGRQGNLDRVVEHFFGPKSFLNTEEPQTIYDNIVNRMKEAESKFEHGFTRGRRSIKTEVDGFDKRVKAEATPYNNELDLDLYVKLFGTDAVFLSLGDDKGYDFNRILDEVLKFANIGINKVKHFQQELRSHILFLDAELSYPTSTGFPLKLDLVGSATGRFEISTNVDIRQCLRSPQNAKVDVKFVPSTDVEVAGLFLVDADAVATGLKVVTNLHSSTGVHVVAKVLENGHGIDLQLGLPIDKQEILTASNDLVYVTVEKGQKEKQVALKVDSDRKEYSGCFDQLSNMLGLTLCGEVSIPFSVSGPEAQASLSKFVARYPLTGASKVRLVLEKNDLRGYHVKGVVRTENPERQSFELLFEAQGSKNRRTQLSGEFVKCDTEKSVKLSLESPITTMYGEVSLLNKPNEFVAFVKAKMDANEYYVRLGFNVQGNDRRRVYKPVVQYKVDEHGERSPKIEGQLVKEVNGDTTKFTVEGVKIHTNDMGKQTVIDVNGHYIMESSGFAMDFKAKKGDQYVLVSGSQKGNDAKLEFRNTLNPNINFKVNGHFEQGNTVRTDIDFYHGGNLDNHHNRVTFNQLLKVKSKSDEEYNLITKNKFEIHCVPFKARFDAEVDSKKVNFDVEGVYLDRHANFKMEARTHIKKPGDYSVRVNAGVNNQGLEVFSKRDIVSPEKSNFENTVTVKNYGKCELSGVVLHKYKQNDVNVGAIGHFKVTANGQNEDIQFDIGLIENSNLYSSHVKLSASKVVFLDYLLKVTRGANANGQLKFILKDAVSANGQFKVTDSDGKGNGMLIVDFPKSKRKIKSDVKFVVKAPVYNAEVDLYLNYEKDNNDKVVFTTQTKAADKHFDSKNTLSYADKKTVVNVRSEGEYDVDSKTGTEVDIELPTGQCVDFKFHRDFTVKDEVYNGHAESSFTVSSKRGGPSNSIAYNYRVVNTNFVNDVIDYQGSFELKLQNGKNLQNEFSFKTNKQGDRIKMEFKSDVNGNVVPEPVSIVASMEGKDTESIDGSDDYYLKATYGNGKQFNFEIKGKEELKLLEKGEKKYLDDYTINLCLPFEKAHDIKIASHVLYLKPENEDVIVEFTVIESVQVNGDVYKFDGSGKFGTKAGFTKVKLLVPHVEPLSCDVNYRLAGDGDRTHGKLDLKALYGKGKTATVSVDASTSPQDYNIKVKAHAPQAEKLKKFELSTQVKNPAPDTYSSTVIVDADGRVYKTEYLAVYSSSQPLFDLKYSGPDQKPSRIYAKCTTKSSNHGKVEVIVENIRDVSFDVSSEGTFEKDHAVLNCVANSKELGLKNYKVDVVAKDKRLEFHATNDNKNVVSGSTSFISKQEGSKTIIEGSGSVKVKEEQKSVNFKYIRTLLTEGDEQGVETFLNMAIGERSYVAESRVTNLEYKYSYVYCEEKKQCAHADLNSKINIQKPGVLQHSLNVGLDLRKLGFAPEFGLQVTSEVSEQRLPQYSLDLHVNKEDKKYHLHVYSQPAEGRYPAGITITLPQRVLALESHVSYATDKGLPFPVKGEVVLHLDKNKPQQKTAARFLVDARLSEKEQSAVAEVGFSHPKLGKEACIKVRGNLQRPNDNTFKIETVGTFTHQPAGQNLESKILFEVNPSHVKLLVNTPVVCVVDLEGSSVMKENLQQGELKFSLLQGKPVQVRAVVKDFQYYEFTTGYSDESQRKLSVVAHLEPEKRVDVSADIVLPGQKKNIVHGALYLQDNQIQNDYGVSKDNFEYFVKALQADLDNLEGRIKQLGDKTSNSFKNSLRRMEPYYNELTKCYQEDLEKLAKEISNDKVLKEISAVLYEVVHFFAELVNKVVEATQPIVDKISTTIVDTTKKIEEMYEKQVEPQLKKLYENVAEVVKEYVDGLINVVAHFAALVADFFEKHKAEFQELTNTLTAIFKDLTRLVVVQLKEFREKASQFFAEVTKQIKEMPVVELVKEKFQELAVPDQVIGFLQEVHTRLRQVLPTEDIKNFADCLYNYVNKKLRQEKVDDNKELRVVYEKFTVALTSFIKFLRAQLNELGVPSFFDVKDFNFPALFGTSQVTAPSLGGTASFSFLNQLVRGDVPDPVALLRAYRPRSVNPLEEVPAKLRAVVVNGQHIFTFDGRHMTFPGNCRYVLAHDYVDGNFSLVLQLQNGQPKSVALLDQSGTTVELKDNGQVALNGAVHGFPVIEKDVFAYKEPSGLIGVGSKYGVLVRCTSKLEVCYVEVNGFYHGKLRGLLGDGNNEPYDDFRLPNGKIVNSESEFGNAQRMATSCPQVKTPDHSTHHMHHLPAACEQVFGGTSPLRPLSLVLDVNPFKQACSHACAGDPADALHQACDLARGYAALAVTGLLPAVLPSVCVQCTDTDKPKHIGDEYELKLPNKQADIIVTVETTKSSEKHFKNLAVPLLSQVIDGLKSKHIDDIKVYLVGVTPKFPYPIVYDTDPRLKNAKVQFDDESRYEKTPSVKTGDEQADKLDKYLAELVDTIKDNLDLTNVEASYELLFNLPLRPGAVKHGINVIGDHCKSRFFLFDLLRAVTYDVIFEQLAYTHTLVTGTPDLKFEGGNVGHVVGFTEDSVLMLGDKKHGKDSEKLRSQLKVEDDSCVFFAESTEGLVLSGNNYHALNAGEQKQYLQTAASAIVNKVTHQTIEQECTCTFVNTFAARSVCVNKDRKEAARRRK